MEYGAIDLHTKESQIRIVTEDGTVVLERRIPTRRDRLTAMFGGRPRMRILLESSTESEWVAQHLEALGHELVVADPNYAPMYGERTRRIKTDRRDVATLAEANRRGFYRPAHRVSRDQAAVRRQLVVREQLIRMRTQTINLLRSQLRSVGLRLTTGAARSVVARCAALDIPATIQPTIAPLLAVLTQLAPLIAARDGWATQAAAADPITTRLMTVPGVGPITALRYRATLDEVHRFRSASAATAYLGLVPREASSAERHHRGAITKAGPARVRAVLVQAGWTIWRSPRGSGTLHAWVHRLADRRGRRVAIVALARRLARILFALWRDGVEFQQTRVTRGGIAA
jgi:transposase